MRRVLVIDDSDDIRQLLEMCLSRLGGYQVDTAAGGHEGVDAARRRRPDAVLLDVMMPELDGPATLHLLRSDPQLQSVPVVFLTAKVTSADRPGLQQLGADGFIAKPFDPRRLPAELERVLGWPGR